ncbi:MAG: hypothetical protein C4336_02365 [Armatimonadota bacterium]
MKRTLLQLNLWSVTLLLVLSVGRAQPSQKYYDARERAAETLTFEWTQQQQVRVSEDLVRSMNNLKLNQAQSLGIPTEQITLLDTRALTHTIFETADYFTIERTPKWTRMRSLYQTISLDQARVSDRLYHDEVCFGSGVVLAIHRTNQGEVASVDIAECEDDVFGLGNPFSNITPEYLVLLGGVSPLRLYGHKPEDWKLVSSNPEEWVFELIAPPQERSVRIWLDRRYQDAPSKIEVRYSHGDVYVWRVLKYERIEGTWFPSEVEHWRRSALEEVLARLVLAGHRRTQSIELKIPDGIAVRDWRSLGRKAWDWRGEQVEQIEWSDGLRQSLGLPTPPKETSKP